MSTFTSQSEAAERKVLFFWAEWHEPSRVGMRQVVEALQIKYPSIVFQSIEAEVETELATKYAITVVPTLLALLQGQVFERVEGVNTAEGVDMVKRLAAAPIASPSTTHVTAMSQSHSGSGKGVESASVVPSPLSTALTQRIQHLIGSAPVMLFMKGTPDTPRCGFSRQVVEIMKDHNVGYGAFDILSDEDIRQGLKVYSEWPTYPQIYSNGELIGGLDILKEMVANVAIPLKTQLGIHDTPVAVSMPPEQHSSLESRIKGLISQSDVVLFMKGTPDEPKCGFSKSIVALLKSQDVVFSFFDILTDADVRQGIKILSEWPTFPQLYVFGDLVGGLDIVQEMISNGPLKQQFERLKASKVVSSMDHDHVHSGSCGHAH